MAERVLRLGRKAEVDKRQSGIGEAACGGTRRKMEEEKERAGGMRNRDVGECAHANGGGFTVKVSRGNGTSVLRVGKPTYRSIDPEPAARFLPIFLFFFLFFFLFLLLSSALGTCAAA
jgi:hypothetical protein